MQERIKVRYTNGTAREVVPGPRDSAFTSALCRESGVIGALRCIQYAVRTPHWGWRLSRCRDEQVGQPNPASTYPDGNPRA